MRQFTIKNRTYTISEEEYRKLLDRFDTSKAFAHESDYRIEMPCICPMESTSSCSRCPLGPKPGGCMSILRNIGFRSCLSYLGLTYTHVSWPAWANTRIRAKFDLLRQKLLKLPEL